MRCQNCKNWLCTLPAAVNTKGVQVAKCRVSDIGVSANSLCNAWELSLSWGQVVEMQPTTDGVAELQARIAEEDDGLPKLSDLKGTMPDDGIPSEEFEWKLRDKWQGA